ncbi:MAG: hypothetical protein JXA46_06400 [Dehalococcoidales bacterium]|nr:hypothetical protein [Dehalococcoidales bacterium]
MGVIKEGDPSKNRKKTLTLSNRMYKCGIVNLDLVDVKLAEMVKKLNSIQKYFLFTKSKSSNSSNYIEKFEGYENLDINLIPQSFYKQKQFLKVDLVVCITKRPIAVHIGETTYFNHFSSPCPEENRFMFISTDMLERFTYQANCTFEKGIVHMLVSQLLVHFTELGYHDETRGCVMDYCKHKNDIIKGLIKKKLCITCRKEVKDGRLLDSVMAVLQDDIIETTENVNRKVNIKQNKK